MAPVTRAKRIKCNSNDQFLNCDLNWGTYMICEHPNYCPNKLPFTMRRNPLKKIEIKVAGEKGLGVFSKVKLNMGVHVMVNLYDNENDNSSTNDQIKYHVLSSSHKHNNIPVLVELDHYFDKVNHSCVPNCILEEWTGKLTKKPVFVLKTLKNITKGTEITFDYQASGKAIMEVVCQCGEKKCRQHL